MMKHTIMVLATTIALTLPAAAQDQGDGSVTLPDICKSGMQHDMGGAMKMDMSGMDQAHQDLMKGMDDMNAKMMQGMTASDIDVAFVCSMIPHHQGAISMAEAELAHGDSQWAKDMAQKVIDAQEAEIAAMREWLARQSQ